MAVPDPRLSPFQGPAPLRTFVGRLLGAARLDRAVYEEIERDTTATGQALAVVLLASIATSVGAGVPFTAVIAGIFASVFLWYVWAALTWWVGTRLLPAPSTRATIGELLRTLGFASGPGIVQIAGVVPPLRRFAAVVAAVWVLAAGVMAVRQALDYDSTWRAVLVVGIGWAVQWLLLAVLFTIARAV